MGLSEDLNKYQLPLAALAGYFGGRWIEGRVAGYVLSLGQIIREGRTQTNGGSVNELRLYKVVESLDERLKRIEENLGR